MHTTLWYRKPLIDIANGSCMFGVLFEFVLIEVKNKWDKYNESWKIKNTILKAESVLSES